MFTYRYNTMFAHSIVIVVIIIIIIIITRDISPMIGIALLPRCVR